MLLPSMRFARERYQRSTCARLSRQYGHHIKKIPASPLHALPLRLGEHGRSSYMSCSQLHAEGFQSFTASDRLADRPFFVAPIFCQDWNTEDHRGYRHSSLIQKQKQHQVYRSLFFLDLAEPTSFPSCNCELTRHVAYLQHASVRFSPNRMLA